VRRRLAIRIAAGLVALAVLALVGIQLVAPGIAEQRLRTRLSHSGNVLSITVGALPAIELLFGHADKVTVRMGTVRVRIGDAGNLLATASETGSLDVHAQHVEIGPLGLDDAVVTKRSDGQLMATALLSDAALASALPPGFAVFPVASGDGKLLLQGQLSAFGVTASADAVLQASNGRLVLAPAGTLANLLSLTVFNDPRVHVDAVGAAAARGGFELTATGHLVG